MERPLLALVPLRRLRIWLWLLLFVLAVGFSWLLFVYPVGAIALTVATATLFALFHSFERTVMCLLLLRSSLDILTVQQVPAMFAIALSLLVLGYVGRRLVLRRSVQCDCFWWVLLSWVLLQGIWVVLLALNGLGGEPTLLAEAVREWVRLFSLAMVYLLVMQLRGRVAPQQLATWLMLSLVVPLWLAGWQWLLPDALPPILQSGSSFGELANLQANSQASSLANELAVASGRIDSSLGHFNSFATFSLLFMALALWRSQLSRRPWIWWGLAGSLLLCLLLSQSLTGLVMLVVFTAVFGAMQLGRLTSRRRLGAVVLVAIAAILVSTILSGPLSQSRLAELEKTPLVNPELSFSQVIALQAADVDAYRNSFNWRLLQWHDLLQGWQRYPVMGHGLATTKAVSAYNNTSHNDYIRFLVEGGVVGLSLFLLFWMAQLAWIGQVLRQSWPGSAQRRLAQMMLAFVIAMLVGMTAGNVMVHTATFFYWWALMAALGGAWPTEMLSASPSKELETL